MGRRGQVSAFIIIGIIVLILVGSVMLVSNYLAEKELEAEIEVIEFSPTAVRTFIEHCFEESSKEAMISVSLQGGYFYTPEESSDQILASIPYYFDLGEKTFPTKEEIENEMSNFIVRKVPVCFGDFAVFKDQGYDFEQGEMQVTVELEDTSIFELYFPLTASKEDSTYSIDEIFTYDIPVDFNNVYSIISEIVDEQELNTNYVPVGFISASAKENSYEFELSYLDDDVVIYSLFFEQYLIDMEEYAFLFACRYDWSHLAAEETT